MLVLLVPYTPSCSPPYSSTRPYRTPSQLSMFSNPVSLHCYFFVCIATPPPAPATAPLGSTSSHLPAPPPPLPGALPPALPLPWADVLSSTYGSAAAPAAAAPPAGAAAPARRCSSRAVAKSVVATTELLGATTVPAHTCVSQATRHKEHIASH